MSNRGSDADFSAIEEMIKNYLGWKELETGARNSTAHKLEAMIEKAGGAARLARAMADDRGVLRAVCDRVLIHETSFFRHRLQFEWLEECGLPELYRSRRSSQSDPKISAWSCACSSGEEAFSLAMILLDAFPSHEGWQVSVLGTDLSRRVLAQAVAATWPEHEQSSIPEDYLTRYFLRGKGRMEGVIRANEALRRNVSFDEHHLGGDRQVEGGPFDIIFCRNVLIYFGAAKAVAVVAELQRALAPDGVIVFGPSDFAKADERGMVQVGPGIFRQERRRKSA
jgi:chemotaxis protein methyltransferase CheR